MEQILVTRQYIQHSGAAYNRAAGELIDNFKKYLKKIMTLSQSRLMCKFLDLHISARTYSLDRDAL